MVDYGNHEKPISSSNDQPVDVKIVSNVGGEIPPANPKLKHFPGWRILAILIGGFAFFNMFPTMNILMRCSDTYADLRAVQNDLLYYVEKHQQFPPPEKWCDTLQDIDDSTFSYYRQYKKDKDDFPCILNKHIFEHKELPGNMVVAFSGKDRRGTEVCGWNLVGDIEMVKDCDRVAVLFGNEQIRVFRKKLVPYLRWRFEDSGVIPKPDIKIPFLVMSTLLAIVFIAILTTCRDSLKIFWLPALGIGIASAVIGDFLSNETEKLFYLLSHGFGEDPLYSRIGGIWGFVIGVCFVAVLGRIYKKYHTHVNLISYAVVLGPMTGIAASSIIHAYLMIAYEETSFSYMLAGSFIGIIAGTLLGLISSGFVSLYKNKLHCPTQK